MAFTLFILTPLAGWAQVSVDAVFNPPVIRLGESSELVITVNGARSDIQVPPFPQIENLWISRNPSRDQTSIQMDGFNVTRKVQRGWQVRAAQPGTFTLPALAITVDGQTYQTPPATIQVGEGYDIFKDAAFFELLAPQTLYVGQAAGATLRLRFRSGLTFTRESQLSHEFTGLTVSDISPQLMTSGTVELNGVRYEEQNYELKLSAIEPGTHTLSFSLDAIIASGRAYDQRKLEARAVIKVLPLPPGAPPSFKGAVGSFAATRALQSQQARVGEPLELLVDISGTGDVEHVPAPVLEESPLWRAYPPTEEYTAGDELGLRGRKRFRFLLSPTREGSLQTPALEFSFLDPETGAYETRTLQGESVSAAPAAPGYIPAPATTMEPSQPVARRNPNLLHPIELGGATQGDFLKPPFRKPLFWVGNGAAALLLGGAAAWRLRRRRLERNPTLRIRSAAAKAARDALRKAEAAVRARDCEAFRNHARAALQHALLARQPERDPATVSAVDVARLLPDGSDGAQAIRAAFLAEPEAAERLEALNANLRQVVAQLEAQR